jgi:lipoprotein-anchoring transpeptidase ErfK/SrfK
MGGVAALALTGVPVVAGASEQKLLPDEPYQVEMADLRTIPAKFHKQLVPYDTEELPGTIVVDTYERFLYLVMEGGQAMRYGIGVGREGFAWNGDAAIKRKEVWPEWRPPEDMREREPELPEVMEGGPENPLGARALYLFEGDKDTLYRIHGTNYPKSIGTAQSSGCIRLLNQDIIDLYRRVPLGSKVVVVGPDLASEDVRQAFRQQPEKRQSFGEDVLDLFDLVTER